MINYRDLANAHIKNLTPYQPGKPIEEVEREMGLTDVIKLASNENPLGPSPLAMQAALNALQNSHIYPDGGCYQIKHKLSAFLNVTPEQLTIGNGSENILEIITKAYLKTGDSAILSQHAFLTILLLIKAAGATPISVPAMNFGHDAKKMASAIDANTRMIFIVNPNNPTGTYLTSDELIPLLNSIPPHILVVMDEAYHEYMDHADYPDTAKLLTQYPNLIITRTFSKAYGLAGLRLGYAISSPDIADILNRARLPFNVNSIAAAAASAALSDQEHVIKSIKLNKEGKLQLEESFNKWKISFTSSAGNFVTIDVKRNGPEVYHTLLQQGIIVRPLVPYEMPSHLRVTIGTLAHNERFLTALHKLMH